MDFQFLAIWAIFGRKEKLLNFATFEGCFFHVIMGKNLFLYLHSGGEKCSVISILWSQPLTTVSYQQKIPNPLTPRTNIMHFLFWSYFSFLYYAQFRVNGNHLETKGIFHKRDNLLKPHKVACSLKLQRKCRYIFLNLF